MGKGILTSFDMRGMMNYNNVIIKYQIMIIEMINDIANIIIIDDNK